MRWHAVHTKYGKPQKAFQKVRCVWLLKFPDDVKPPLSLVLQSVAHGAMEVIWG